MVKLNLIVEGGVYTENVYAETANNAEALRESLHKFFTRLLARDDVVETKLLQKREMRKDIVIELSYKGFSRASDYS